MCGRAGPLFSWVASGWWPGSLLLLSWLSVMQQFCLQTVVENIEPGPASFIYFAIIITSFVWFKRLQTKYLEKILPVEKAIKNLLSYLMEKIQAMSFFLFEKFYFLVSI